MNKYIILLAVAAVIQLGLIMVTWMDGSDLKTQAARTTLLVFDGPEIDQILIKDEKEEVILDKKEGKWQTREGFPADQTKVKTLLNKLRELKTGLPVATSTSALNRFKVAEDKYERYLQLKKDGDVIAELYLGTGAGARQSHARSGDQDAVFTVAMGSYDAPATVTSWQDKTVLKLDKDTVTAVRLNDLLIQREPPSPAPDSTDKENAAELAESNKAVWTITPPADNRKLDQDAVNQGMDKLYSLRFDSLLGKENKPEYGLDSPILEVTVTHGDSQRTYSFGTLKDSEDYVLHVSDRAEYFKIAGYEGKSIVDTINLDRWLVKPAKDETLSSSTAEREKHSQEAEFIAPVGN
jgi:hypothetical protein